MRKAVVVGIDNYPSAPLRCCGTDADEIAAILEMPEYGYSVDLLLNEKATRRNVLGALNSLFTAPTTDALFYFAGHGVSNDLGVFLATIDGDEIEPGMSLDYLRNVLRKPAATGIAGILILDCCHAGAAVLRGGAGYDWRPMASENVIDSVQGLTGKVVFAACRSNEGAQESERLKHGLFTYHIIDGLLGGASDTAGDITVASLYDYVARPFENVVGQIPVFRGDLVGRLVVGSNLPPRAAHELAANELLRIEQQSEAIVNEYVRMTAMDVDTWMASGYLDACGRLAPILRWLNRYKHEYPKIRLDPRFRNALQTANSKLAHLGDLVVGLHTPLGVIKEKLGSGTFGSVWRLIDEAGADMAYKVYHPTELENQEKLDRFDRGFRAMQQLNHSNIAKVYQFTEVPVGFTMEFVPGMNARDYVTSTFELIEGLRHLGTVAQAVVHAHSRGVMHRDLKPENILMRWTDAGDYEAVLSDFDLAWFSTATQLTRQGFGTYIYGSPEQIEAPRSNAAHEPPTDVYSLGQLLFFFVCGRDPAPRLADNHYAIVQKLTAELREVPARLLADLYEQSTRISCAQRLQSASEFTEVLYEAMSRIEGDASVIALEGRSFARELVFSFAGLDERRRLNDRTFITESGTTVVEVLHAIPRGGHMSVDVRLHCQYFAIAGVDAKTARRTVNQRLDDYVAMDRRLSRKAGKQLPLETFITLKDLKPTLVGVADAQQALKEVIAILERRE